VRAARRAWPRRRRRAAGPGGAGRLVFLDETGARSGLCREHGRSPRGRRARAARPFGGWRSVTLVSAVRASGVAGGLLLKGALDAAAFGAFLERVLLPALAPGDVLVTDNLAVHKTRAARELIAAAGVLPLYLPAYSPDLSPIENVFAKVKAGVRAAAAGTVPTLFDAFSHALAAVTPEDCRGCFRACGIRV
jgi:transposase